MWMKYFVHTSVAKNEEPVNANIDLFPNLSYFFLL